MSRIYDALRRLEAERRRAANGGAGNGRENGGGNGAGWRENGQWRWQAILERLSASSSRGNRKVAPGPVNFDLGPEAEEAYHRLGTSLLLGPASEAERVPKLLGLVAARHGEGTTTTAAVFGSILVRRRGGRVAVVETNFRSPAFDTAFGIAPNGGFAELVRGGQGVESAAQPTVVPNLFAIGCGEADRPIPALFDAPGLPNVLDHLRGQFDFVIFDLPPVTLYGDALIFGPRLDATIVVIEADATRIPDVERARRMLERAGVRVVGSVLNRRRNYIPAFLEEML